MIALWYSAVCAQLMLSVTETLRQILAQEAELGISVPWPLSVHEVWCVSDFMVTDPTPAQMAALIAFRGPEGECK